jgi:hypothetical protein
MDLRKLPHFVFRLSWPQRNRPRSLFGLGLGLGLGAGLGLAVYAMKRFTAEEKPEDVVRPKEAPMRENDVAARPS